MEAVISQKSSQSGSYGKEAPFQVGKKHKTVKEMEEKRRHKVKMKSSPRSYTVERWKKSNSHNDELLGKVKKKRKVVIN